MKTQPNKIFIQLIRNICGVEVVPEYKFHPTRKWRFDYAIPQYKIALEVEGGVWTGGRHTSAKGFLGDMEKYNTATILGWRVARCVPATLLSTETIEMIKKLIQHGINE